MKFNDNSSFFSAPSQQDSKHSAHLQVPASPEYFLDMQGHCLRPIASKSEQEPASNKPLVAAAVRVETIFWTERVLILPSFLILLIINFTGELPKPPHFWTGVQTI